MKTKWNDQVSVAMHRWSGKQVPLVMPAYTRRSSLTVIKCSQCHNRLEQGDDIVPCGSWSILHRGTGRAIRTGYKSRASVFRACRAIEAATDPKELHSWLCNKKPDTQDEVGWAIYNALFPDTASKRRREVTCMN